MSLDSRRLELRKHALDLRATITQKESDLEGFREDYLRVLDEMLTLEMACAGILIDEASAGRAETAGQPITDSGRIPSPPGAVAAQPSPRTAREHHHRDGSRSGAPKSAAEDRETPDAHPPASDESAWAAHSRAVNPMTGRPLLREGSDSDRIVMKLGYLRTATLDEIAAKVDKSAKDVRALLDYLKKKGLVDREDSSGKWMLTDDGDEYVNRANAEAERG